MESSCSIAFYCGGEDHCDYKELSRTKTIEGIFVCIHAEDIEETDRICRNIQAQRQCLNI